MRKEYLKSNDVSIKNGEDVKHHYEGHDVCDSLDNQEIARKLRAGNAVVNSSVGIHIHIGCENFNANQVRNFVNATQNGYAAAVFFGGEEALNKQKPKTLKGIEDLWYRKYYDDRN